jgi:hypothetical protein
MPLNISPRLNRRQQGMRVRDVRSASGREWPEQDAEAAKSVSAG